MTIIGIETKAGWFFGNFVANGGFCCIGALQHTVEVDFKQISAVIERHFIDLSVADQQPLAIQ